jgi:hypothetical protein
MTTVQQSRPRRQFDRAILVALAIGLLIGAAARWATQAPNRSGNQTDNQTDNQTGNPSGNQTTNPTSPATTNIDVPPVAKPPPFTGPREIWAKPVPHLFFHPLVTDVAAFRKGRIAKGFLDYFVTVDEFKRILDQLLTRNYVLVDLHKAVSDDLLVPVGKQPLVISVDDLNYYAYLQTAGLPKRLVIGTDGQVVAELVDGTRDRNADVVPILDDFVRAHPEFSPDGDKATLNVTGYEGVFGYPTNWIKGVEPSQADVETATEIATALKATGWTFASHTYGHITVPERSVKRIEEDTARWLKEVAPIVGPTDVLVYPYGASVPMSSARAGAFRKAGFRIFCDISGQDLTIRKANWTTMSRHHVDGIGFRDQPDQLAAFFDVSTVVDRSARAADPEGKP